MSIQKIKESEIQSKGVASLASRPSLPSLYSGRSLSAEELKRAFDSLPRLLAERFNELIESLGLYEEGKALESFAEVLATGLRQGHSLADLIEEIQNGTFCSYLSVDGVHTLTEALAALSERIDQTFTFDVTEIGGGDIVTSITEQSDTLLVYKALDSSRFATKTETKLLKDSLADWKENTVESYELHDVNARLSNVEETLKGKTFSYREESAVSHGSTVPADSLPYAMIDRVGGLNYKEAVEGNAFPESYVDISHTPSDEVGYRGSITVEGRAITFDGRGLYEDENMKLILCDQKYEAGTYHLEPLGTTTLAYAVSMYTNGTKVKDFKLYESATKRSFLVPENVDRLLVRLVRAELIYPVTVTPVMWREILKPTAVTHVRSVGKNLLPPEVYDLASWTPIEPAERSVFMLSLPEYGTYTVSLKVNFTTSEHYLYLQRSVDGGKKWTSAYDDDKLIYLIGGANVYAPITFTYRKGEMWRLWYYPTSKAEHFSEISELQIELGSEATAYEPYKEALYTVPESVLTLDAYGCGLSENCYNYVDLAERRYYKNVGIRKYEEGDENNAAVLTDGKNTVYALAAPEFIDLGDVVEAFGFPSVTHEGSILFDNEGKQSVPHTITYQIKLSEGETV